VPPHQYPYLGFGNPYSEYTDERPSVLHVERFGRPNTESFTLSRAKLPIVGGLQVRLSGSRVAFQDYLLTVDEIRGHVTTASWKLRQSWLRRLAISLVRGKGRAESHDFDVATNAVKFQPSTGARFLRVAQMSTHWNVTLVARFPFSKLSDHPAFRLNCVTSVSA
jgi:hypothetical protein